jgi:signal transduction histidine kinase
MSFRQKLFLSIVVAVLITVLIESGIDSVIQHARAEWEVQTEEELRQYTREIVALLELDDLGYRSEEDVRQHLREIADLLEPSDEALSRLPDASLAALAEREGRFRVMVGDEVLLSSPRAFPAPGVAWATRDRDLGNRHYLEVALERNPAERILSNIFLLQVIDLPLFFALAFAVAWLLTRFVMRPVRDLTLAFEQISTQHFPEPITVPRSDDELSQMARSFNVMTMSIKELLERERAFTRYASHELRTPLSALKMQVERAEMGLASPEAVMPVLERNIRRMEEILSVLLALSRASERDPKPTLLRPLVQELLATFPSEAKRRLKLHDKTQAQVEVSDARLVFQALGNLVENALRYSDGPIDVTVEDQGKNVSLSVRDTGPGVPEELLDKLTKPFFRAGKHSKSLGLGLSLVENVARSLKGTLRLRNTHPGLEATLSLPIVVSAGEHEGGSRAQGERLRQRRLTTSSRS